MAKRRHHRKLQKLLPKFSETVGHLLHPKRLRAVHSVKEKERSKLRRFSASYQKADFEELIM